ncbi:MAG: hypothetical protein EB127_31685 [Alphaproteobacteria bacterium]|jgi:hypothetical protein|nr:hypothetical protein [Alphaproteobacteria bacterium]
MTEENKNPKKILEVVNNIGSVWENIYEMMFTVGLGVCLLLNLNPLNIFTWMGLASGKKGTDLTSADKNTEIRMVDKRSQVKNDEITGRRKQKQRQQEEKIAKKQLEAELAKNNSNLSKDNKE